MLQVFPFVLRHKESFYSTIYILPSALKPITLNQLDCTQAPGHQEPTAQRNSQHKLKRQPDNLLLSSLGATWLKCNLTQQVEVCTFCFTMQFDNALTCNRKSALTTISITPGRNFSWYSPAREKQRIIRYYELLPQQ